MDSNTIGKENGTQPIQWKFNPPSVAWWGGFWERLIRSVKDLLRKTLGRASVTQSELHILLKKVTEVINGRPLTYLSEDPSDLEPLTPEMLIRTPVRAMMPELEMTEGEALRVRHKYLMTMKEELKKRFRSEYLALLKALPKRSTRTLEVGEIVFIGSDQHKRIEWQLGRIIEFYPGKDGVSRVARLKTAMGEMTRPVQRLHPLEIDVQEAEKVRTRIGREVKVPNRLGI